MNELIETLFYNFLETTNDETDDDDVMVDVGTLRTGFYAGFAAAQKVQYVKLRYALRV